GRNVSIMNSKIDGSNNANNAHSINSINITDNADNALVKVIYNEEHLNERPAVLGRDLHKALDIQTPYHKWFPRMCEYGFTKDKDYMILVGQKCPTNNPKNPWTEVTDHQLTIDMAKEICMLQRTEIGKRCREYFLEIERQWNSPDAVMARALQMANRRVDMLRQQTLQLTEAIAVKDQQIAEIVYL
ncbi:MAG: antA/AntB antirepressor family protein, partial [Synergistaceae bacterium]|nr:antA/AntB antirepressor family protein [Synergistaceae bacterium]